MLKRLNKSMMGDHADDQQKNKKKKNTDSEIEKISKEQIRNLLKEALKADLDHRTRTALSNKEAVMSTLEEFLNSFIVLGYDMDGNLINLIHAKTQQDADSLSTAINRFFMQNNNTDMF
jgi:hypothetical protein